MRRASLLGLLLALACAAWPAGAGAAMSQESTFQDDNMLLYSEPADVARTLDTLAGIGVDRIRATVLWKVVAPLPEQDERPEFDAADPAAYPPGTWQRYDTLLALALERGMRVNFNVSAPAPDWATGTPERGDIDETYEPNAHEFDLFVRAVGTRYSGTYTPSADAPALPRVDYWSIYNEPNHPGWLTPQWQADPRRPRDFVETSPRIYRDLVDAAYDALVATGHERDTILVGETAPKGLNKLGITRGIKPGRFIKQLYCLDDNLQFLAGQAAQDRGCPTGDQARRFVEQHPGLFRFTGWAHHPYELTFAPSRRPVDRDFFTIANLDDLSGLLRRILDRYGQPRRPGGVPLFLTEFGYQTNPPDPLGVSPAKQASYLNQSEFIAWRNPRVKTLAQFLLVDDQPLPGYSHQNPNAWGATFQSGLVTIDNKHKPAYSTYQLPIHLPRSSVRRGSRLRVWGFARAAPNGAGPRVDVLLRYRRSKRPFRKIRTVTGAPMGYVSTRIRVRRSGYVKLQWTGPDGRVVISRAAAFRIRRR